MDDHPAAHSMDTTWFAVDRHGRIGLFDSGEDGAVPIGAAIGASPGDPTFDDSALYAELLARLHGGRAEEQDALAVENLRYTLRVDRALDPPLFVFSRDHGDDPGRYQHSGSPFDPLTVDELEPGLSAALSQLRLPVDFARRRVVHLADHLADHEASTWGNWPLRYTEAYFEEQRRAQERARAEEARQRQIARVLLLVIVFGSLAWVLAVLLDIV